MILRELPDWWKFVLVLSPHLIERMQDRGFTEVDLRAMFTDARGFRQSIVPGRFIVTTRHDGKEWEIIVEPDISEEKIVVITAYGV